MYVCVLVLIGVSSRHNTGPPILAITDPSKQCDARAVVSEIIISNQVSRRLVSPSFFGGGVDFLIFLSNHTPG